MNDTRQVIPIAGLVATFGIAAYMVVQLNGQTPPIGDLSNAATAEVHDQQGQVILRGQFAANDEEDADDVERKATLEATGIDTDARGDAEVEVPTTGTGSQEVEFSVRNLQPGTVLTFVVDGQTIGQATVDRRGRAEIDLDVKTGSN